MSDHKLPSHAVVDGDVHRITKIDEHPTGPMHTHRVWLDCGMTIDVDIGGVRKHAMHTGRSAEHADPYWQEKHADIAEEALMSGDSWAHDRWTKHDSKATCGHCIGTETGTKKIINHKNAHTPAKTVEADIKTGLNCPTCGGDLYIRRREGTVACTKEGHAFTIPEVLTTSMGLLHKLAIRTMDFKPLKED